MKKRHQPSHLSLYCGGPRHITVKYCPLPQKHHTLHGIKLIVFVKNNCSLHLVRDIWALNKLTSGKRYAFPSISSFQGVFERSQIRHKARPQHAYNLHQIRWGYELRATFHGIKHWRMANCLSWCYKNLVI